jgi:hypothetical protein
MGGTTAFGRGSAALPAGAAWPPAAAPARAPAGGAGGAWGRGGGRGRLAGRWIVSTAGGRLAAELPPAGTGDFHALFAAAWAGRSGACSPGALARLTSAAARRGAPPRCSAGPRSGALPRPIAVEQSQVLHPHRWGPCIRLCTRRRGGCTARLFGTPAHTPGRTPTPSSGLNDRRLTGYNGQAQEGHRSGSHRACQSASGRSTRRQTGVYVRYGRVMAAHGLVGRGWRALDAAAPGDARNRSARGCSRALCTAAFALSNVVMHPHIEAGRQSAEIPPSAQARGVANACTAASLVGRGGGARAWRSAHAHARTRAPPPSQQERSPAHSPDAGCAVSRSCAGLPPRCFQALASHACRCQPL